jgi:uracil-DNA glycosylase
MATIIPDTWQSVLEQETQQPYWEKLQAYLAQERAEHTIFPPEEDVFRALELTPYQQVRVLLLGQDPYHGPGQAHGLCFSVRPGIALPPSLLNMFKELKSDMGIAMPKQGFLEPWAKQGMLMINAVLTVRQAEANSHKGRGWERFTDAIIRTVNAKSDPVVFVLWGNYAQKKQSLIDTTRHTIIQSAHPSPLSAHNGFFGSKPYSQINAALQSYGYPPINWDVL